MTATSGRTGLPASDDRQETPAFVTDFLIAYVAARGLRPRRVLGLWDTVGLLPRLADAWPHALVTGVLGVGHRRRDPAGLDRDSRLSWRPEPERDVVATTDPGLDVVVGFPPWHWHPRQVRAHVGGGTLVLTEDEANVAILESSARL